MELKEGMKAPDFVLKDTQGKLVKLESLKGRQVVLYFYPRDDTPGCTIEACSFRDSMADFKKMGALVYGINLDNQDSHQKFTEKHGLNFPLLSDTDASVSKEYGVYVKKNLYGKEYWGIARTTFIIDKNGLVKKIFPKVKVEEHANEVLEEL